MLRDLDSKLAKRRDLTYIGYFLIIYGYTLAQTQRQVLIDIGICFFIIAEFFIYRYVRLTVILAWSNLKGLIDWYLFLPRMLFAPKKPKTTSEETYLEEQKQPHPDYQLICAGIFTMIIGLGTGVNLGAFNSSSPRDWTYACIAITIAGFILFSLGFIGPMRRQKQSLLYMLRHTDVDELNSEVIKMPQNIGILVVIPILLIADIVYLFTCRRGFLVLGLLLASTALLYVSLNESSSSAPDSWIVDVLIIFSGSLVTIAGLIITMNLGTGKSQTEPEATPPLSYGAQINPYQQAYQNYPQYAYQPDPGPQYTLQPGQYDGTPYSQIDQYGSSQVRQPFNQP